MASAASDWSPMEKILVGLCGTGSDSQLSYLTLVMAYLTVSWAEGNGVY